MHASMTDDYGIPVWGSYLIFAVATIILGLLIGLVSLEACSVQYCNAVAVITYHVGDMTDVCLLFMVALCNRADHYIFVLWFLLSFFFFLASSQRSEIGCLPYFHTWCGLSGNLGCRSEKCCTWLAENAGRKKSPKSRHLRTIVQLCRAISSQLRQISTIGKNLLSSNISSRCPPIW